MSHFLARLVERARGTAARVEPMIVPRFAPSPVAEIAAEVETPRPEASEQPATLEEKLLPHPAVQAQAVIEKTEPKVFLEPKKSSLPQRQEKLLVPVEKSAVESTIFVRPSRSSEPPVPAVRNEVSRRSSFTAQRAKRPRPNPLHTTKIQNIERTLLRPNESSDEPPPIVRVTIGRIDVRATPPPVPSRK